jgi:hypothetical protein
VSGQSEQDNPGSARGGAGLRGAWASGGLLSPKSFLEVAALFAGLYLVLSLFGLREHTTFLSGTLPDSSRLTGVFLGALYVIVYFLFVLISPILVLAAVLCAGMRLVLAPLACDARLGGAPDDAESRPED